MGAIENFREIKKLSGSFSKWKNMIGKQYGGGGGGIGDIHSILISMTVYYQEKDGSKNYHETPEEINSYLAKATSFYQEEIIKKAEELINLSVKEAAIKCEDEIKRIQEELK